MCRLVCGVRSVLPFLEPKSISLLLDFLAWPDLSPTPARIPQKQATGSPPVQGGITRSAKACGSTIAQPQHARLLSIREPSGIASFWVSSRSDEISFPK